MPTWSLLAVNFHPTKFKTIHLNEYIIFWFRIISESHPSQHTMDNDIWQLCCTFFLPYIKSALEMEASCSEYLLVCISVLWSLNLISFSLVNNNLSLKEFSKEVLQLLPILKAYFLSLRIVIVDCFENTCNVRWIYNKIN